MDIKLHMHISEPNCNYLPFIRIKCSLCNFKLQGYQLFFSGYSDLLQSLYMLRHDYLPTRIKHWNIFNLLQIDFPTEYKLFFRTWGNKKRGSFDTIVNMHRCRHYLLPAEFTFIMYVTPLLAQVLRPLKKIYICSSHPGPSQDPQGK